MVIHIFQLVSLPGANGTDTQVFALTPSDESSTASKSVEMPIDFRCTFFSKLIYDDVFQLVFGYSVFVTLNISPILYHHKKLILIMRNVCLMINEMF